MVGRAVTLFVAALWLGGCGEEEPQVLGEAGESCTARRDCTAGLVCVGEVCQASDALSASSSPRSGLGESCRARNDCQAGLACVGGSCVTGEANVMVTAKECVRVECEAKEDCCRDFLPSPSCDIYEQDCAADPIYCPTFRSLCECNRGCEDNLCVDAALACNSHEECGSFLEPFCVAGFCVECAEHGDCPGERDSCVDGVCQAACTTDEACPLLHACQDGECVETGCMSDRECFFLLGDPRAQCSDGDCEVPCEQDSDCARELGEAAFEVCEEGRCVFVGCETDAECRAFLGLEQAREDVRAVCR